MPGLKTCAEGGDANEFMDRLCKRDIPMERLPGSLQSTLKELADQQSQKKSDQWSMSLWSMIDQWMISEHPQTLERGQGCLPWPPASSMSRQPMDVNMFHIAEYTRVSQADAATPAWGLGVQSDPVTCVWTTACGDLFGPILLELLPVHVVVPAVPYGRTCTDSDNSTPLDILACWQRNNVQCSTCHGITTVRLLRFIPLMETMETVETMCFVCV